MDTEVVWIQWAEAEERNRTRPLLRRIKFIERDRIASSNFPEPDFWGVKDMFGNRVSYIL
jgi:hypothetical protein